MARTFPTYLSPIDAYGSDSVDRPLAYFEWAIPAGHTTGSCQVVYIKVSDAGVQAAEYYNRGLFVSYTNTGAKSANADVEGVAVEINSTAACSSVWGVNVYTGGCAAGTVGRLAAYTCYMDAVSGTVSQMSGAFLYIDATGATRASFLEVRNAGTVADSIIQIRGGICATYLLRTEQEALPYSSYSSGTTVTGRLGVITGTTVGYLHIYSS